MRWNDADWKQKRANRLEQTGVQAFHPFQLPKTSFIIKVSDSLSCASLLPLIRKHGTLSSSAKAMWTSLVLLFNLLPPCHILSVIYKLPNSKGILKESLSHCHSYLNSTTLSFKVLPRFSQVLWTLKRLGVDCFTPSWIRTRYTIGRGCIGPQANFGRTRGKHSPSAGFFLSDCIRHKAPRGFFVSARMWIRFPVKCQGGEDQTRLPFGGMWSIINNSKIKNSELSDSSSNKFRQPKLSASRAVISNIPALIRWCDLMCLSAVESRLSFHAKIDNCCGKGLSISRGI